MKLLGILALVFFLVGCSPSPEEQAEIDKCVDRGITYFAQTGSYPKLKSEPNKGRHAKDVALERCKRTTTAF